MANILNQKEEVIKIELTKHGRKLLGLGLFKPEYFSFFDNSIIYDSSYGGVTNEDVNNIQDRILDNSLTFSSLNITKDILKNKLGTSDTLNDNMPAWQLYMLKGNIKYLRDESEYAYKKFDYGNIIYTVTWESDMADPVIDGDYLLFDLQELNITDDMANFELELFAIDDISGGTERKLYFNKGRSNIIDDIIYEESELPSRFFDVEINEKDAAYYFDVLVDDEIDTEFIVPLDKSLPEKIRGTYITNLPASPNTEYDCPPTVDPKC